MLSPWKKSSVAAEAIDASLARQALLPTQVQGSVASVASQHVWLSRNPCVIRWPLQLQRSQPQHQLTEDSCPWFWAVHAYLQPRSHPAKCWKCVVE